MGRAQFGASKVFSFVIRDRNDSVLAVLVDTPVVRYLLFLIQTFGSIFMTELPALSGSTT